MDQTLLRSYFATVYEFPTHTGAIRASLDGEIVARFLGPAGSAHPPLRRAHRLQPAEHAPAAAGQRAAPFRPARSAHPRLLPGRAQRRLRGRARGRVARAGVPRPWHGPGRGHLLRPRLPPEHHPLRSERPTGAHRHRFLPPTTSAARSRATGGYAREHPGPRSTTAPTTARRPCAILKSSSSASSPRPPPGAGRRRSANATPWCRSSTPASSPWRRPPTTTPTPPA